jgi:hypothetical protein
MNLVLQRAAWLPRGSVQLPARLSDRPVRTVRFGCLTAEVTSVRHGRPGVVRLAPDLWRKLWVPYDSMPVAVRTGAPGDLVLGPTVAVLYAGACRLSRAEAVERLELYYGHLDRPAGLLAIGFEESIDWRHGTMEGYLWEERRGRRLLLRTRFPIPAVVRLTWSIRQETIRQLRERTGNRTFNWVRNIGKWQFHTLLSAVEDLREYLPQTRLLRSPLDLMAMIARHDMVFVKNVFGLQGRSMARIQRLPEGFLVRHMDGSTLVERPFESVDDLVPYVRGVVGPGRAIIQQGLPLVGRLGRALDFRVVVAREGADRWRCLVVNANVAPDDRVVFTNIANGATDEDALESLQQHCGLTEKAAADCQHRMCDLCLRAAEVLGGQFHPLGLLGFDVGVDTTSGRLWLLEANSVPGWGYPPPIEMDLARSQADYALELSGFAP